MAACNSILLLVVTVRDQRVPPGDRQHLLSCLPLVNDRVLAAYVPCGDQLHAAGGSSSIIR